MAVPVGLLLTGVVIRAILAGVLITALVFLLWKISKLADAYTEKLGGK